MQLQRTLSSAPFALGTLGAAAVRGAQEAPGSKPEETGRPSEGRVAEKTADAAAGKTAAETDPKVKARISDLVRRDREVRAHEAAHAAVGGAYVRGGPSFSYTTGPDGKRYAAGGEVQIDTSPVPGDARATAQKMRVVKAAALAPAQPSGQDLAVAAAASRTEVAAALSAAAEKSSSPGNRRLGTQLDLYG